ncbi:MAG: hypothetical protein J3Q66DRAFT_325304, partial [Benniella sp.]
MTFSPSEYFRSPFNWVDLAACLFPIAGCIIFLRTTPSENHGGIDIDGGPSQIWPMGFGILALYLNMLFELRIITQLGFVVNIIFNIARKIKWFFLVFAVFLVSFTHGFLYVIHTRRYRPCDGDSCKDAGYPTGFFGAFLATYFFLFGRYDPVEDAIENGTFTFHIMMVIFFFFTVILLLNVLIALVNDAFSESVNESGSSNWKLVADVIAEVETQAIFSVLLRGYSGSGHEYIYYCADDEEVDNFRSRHSILQASDLSPENRFVVASSREAHAETHSTQRVMLDELQRENQETKQELAELKAMVKILLQNSGLSLPSPGGIEEPPSGRSHRATSSTAYRRPIVSTHSQSVPYSY